VWVICGLAHGTRTRRMVHCVCKSCHDASPVFFIFMILTTCYFGFNQFSSDLLESWTIHEVPDEFDACAKIQYLNSNCNLSKLFFIR
jgi:hypothetical protein